MPQELLTVLVSFVTAIIVFLVTEYVKSKQESKKKINQINLEYLNPLRLYLEETYVRLLKIKLELKTKGTIDSLDYIKQPEKLLTKEKEWFVQHGTYLVSSSYFTACLFYFMKKVRDDIPYLKLAKNKDTKLLRLIFDISFQFRTDLGIFYAIQQSIGNEMANNEKQKLKSYREFCEDLRDANNLIWYTGLITFFIELGKGQRFELLSKILLVIETLSKFLDKNIKGGASLKERLIAEGLIKE